MLLISHQKIGPDLKKSFCEIFSLTITDQEKSIPPNSPYFSFSENTLSLYLNKKVDSSEEKKPSMASNPPPLSFDFIDTWKKIKPGFKNQRKKDPLLKALAIKKHGNEGPIRLIDATCGTGKDSLFFIKQGIQTFAYERSPFLAPLLWDAKRRASTDPELGPILKENFAFSFANAMDHKLALKDGVLSSNTNSRNLFVPDIIFLDPMFPPKRKKALPKKEMVIFSQLVGPDHDQEALLKWALDLKPQRVIVKRPTWATPSKDFPPDTSYQGKTVKFDTYFPNL